MATQEKTVNATRLIAPMYLTLTGTPANQVGFRVVRSDDGGMARTTTRRTRRSDSLLSITFPAGTTADDVAAAMAEYGIDGYTTEEGEDGKMVCRREGSDGKTGTKINLRGDRVAEVVITPTEVPGTVCAGVGVVRMDFSQEFFPEISDVTDWCMKNGIDTSSVQLQNSPTTAVTSIIRSEVPEGSDVHKMVIDDGVSFAVTRADSNDIPEKFIEVVSETAYGSWGWGQLDFMAALADREFCDAAETALYRLRDVLDRIIYYSSLPLTARKELVVRATTQYAAHLVALLDALPEKVVIANRSDSHEKEVTMSQKPNETAVQRTDAPATQTTAPDAKGTVTLTRADVEQIVASAVASAMAQRSDAQPSDQTTTTTQTTAPESTEEAGTSVESITRSVKELANAVSTIAGQVEKIGSQSIVRSDASDSATSASGTKRSDVFAGVFSTKPAKQ